MRGKMRRGSGATRARAISVFRFRLATSSTTTSRARFAFIGLVDYSLGGVPAKPLALALDVSDDADVIRHARAADLEAHHPQGRRGEDAIEAHPAERRHRVGVTEAPPGRHEAVAKAPDRTR